MAIGWIDAGGVSLRYELGGSDGPLVVLLHEMAGTLESWDLVMPALQKRYRTLRYDMRGAGLSEKIRGEVSGDQLADDLKSLLDGLHLSGKAALIGCAVGANVALRFAARHPAHTGAVAISSPATHIPAERRDATYAMIDGFLRDGLRSIEEKSLLTSYPEEFRTLDPERFASTRSRWLGNDPESFAAIYRMLASSDLEMVFPQVVAPCLLIGCLQDAGRPPEGVQMIADRIKDARFVTILSAHFPAIQNPEAFLGLVLPFLEKNWQG
ncbi:3-oxoadipate enol-lactonase [Rhizobium sp. BK313]|uniref:alpha/beta fold hydrolase n=1 Tax=Rhizobium sp. BK313 TaxID=2587081 RepID=UPI00105FEF24|nr:alpha/beta hydrolase [Rhizobium sp. BK313]MBB3459301.1 3-oxoadipate enol-lactonase [Rhizobium sp. BK313]